MLMTLISLTSYALIGIFLGTDRSSIRSSFSLLLLISINSSFFIIGFFDDVQKIATSIDSISFLKFLNFIVSRLSSLENSTAFLSVLFAIFILEIFF